MDPEIKAMADIAAALSPLDEQATSRVLKWAAERFSVSLAPVPPPRQTPAPVSDSQSGTSADASGSAGTPASSPQVPAAVPAFADFHELFDAVNPATSVDKALVAGYWFQVSKGQDDLDSFQLNKELKNLGHPSTNITRDLDYLINKTPRLAMQVRKDGSSKQARKKYKLTREGIKAVERMLAKPH